MQSKFEQLYDMYYDCVYRYIFVSVKNKCNAETILSTVFTTIFDIKDKITDLVESKIYIFRIAHNDVMDFYEKNNKVIPRKSFLGIQDEAIVISHEFNIVREIIDQLPEDTREMLYLRFYGGLNFREISKTINISENTIKSIILKVTKIHKTYEYDL